MNRKELTWIRNDRGCILVTSHKLNRDGYVRVCRGGRYFYLHRRVCERRHGPLSIELEATHSCDTPNCINPDHLKPGRHFDNMQDAKNRLRMNRGTQHPSNKLTEDQVREIKTGNLSSRKAAVIYGVQRRTILDIRRGRTWRHLQDA